MSSKYHVLIRDVNGVEKIIKRNDICKVEPDTAGVTTIWFYRSRAEPMKVGCTVNFLYNNILYPTT